MEFSDCYPLCCAHLFVFLAKLKSVMQVVRKEHVIEKTRVQASQGTPGEAILSTVFSN